MQIHKRLSLEYVRLTLDWYEQQLLSQDEALRRLGVKRRRFFSLLKMYRAGQLRTLAPVRTNRHRRLPSLTDQAIRAELAKEKRLIEDTRIPLQTYNYAAIRDTVVEQTGLPVSAQTVRRRARAWGYYQARPKPRLKHTRVVLTTASGLLLQHDASRHLWSPYAGGKWSLITTIDDYSRLLLFAELYEEETTWAHIQALKHVVLTYGVGANYYTDNHVIFRYVDFMDSLWRTPKIDSRNVKTQWERTVRECGMGNIYALSPEAKGKIERPYRWLQDRLVRSCAKQNVTTINQARELLRKEVDRYNTRQVHSTTGEIPLLRFNRAKQSGQTVFRGLRLPKPYTSTKDVFCLKEERVVNGYGQVVWNKHYFRLPKHVPERARVELHVLPDSSHPEIRVWYKEELVLSVLLEPTHKTV